MSSAETTTPSMKNCCGGNEASFDCAEFMQTMRNMCASTSEGKNATDCCSKMKEMCSGVSEAVDGQQR